VKVVAIEIGYYPDCRRRIGAVFDFAEKDMKNGALPAWVLPATDENIAYAKGIPAARDARIAAGSLASAGRSATFSTARQAQYVRDVTPMLGEARGATKK
jgi:hypothetical protein